MKYSFQKMEYSQIFDNFFHNILWFERIFLKKFNISKNNIINVELAKVLGYSVVVEMLLVL
jgi:hypothetical protein